MRQLHLDDFGAWSPRLIYGLAMRGLVRVSPPLARVTSPAEGDGQHRPPSAKVGPMGRFSAVVVVFVAGCNNLLGIGDVRPNEAADAPPANADTPVAVVDASLDAGPPDAKLSWSVPALLQNVNSSMADERFPAVSDDGLELYFARGSLSAPYGEIWEATRASTSSPFATPQLVSTVNGSSTNEQLAIPAHNGRELFVLRANQILDSVRSSAAAEWGTPTPTNLGGYYFSLSADDLTMYVVERCPMNVLQGFGPCLLTATRANLNSTTWSTPVYQPWAGDVQWYTADVAPDGLSMIVSDPVSGSGTPVAIESRAKLSDAWGNLDTIGPLELESTTAEARWNKQRNEIYLTEHPAGSGGHYDIYISVLQ